MNILKATAIALLVCMGSFSSGVPPVAAQGTQGSPKTPGERVKGYDDWQFSFNLTGWLSSFQGNTKALGKTSHIDVALDNVLTCFFMEK